MRRMRAEKRRRPKPRDLAGGVGVEVGSGGTGGRLGGTVTWTHCDRESDLGRCHSIIAQIEHNSVIELLKDRHSVDGIWFNNCEMRRGQRRGSGGTEAVFSQVNSSGSAGMIDQLSKRENDIVELAAKGRTDREIASELNIASGTLNTYWMRIRTKLNMSMRGEIVALFVKAEGEREKAELAESAARSAAFLLATSMAADTLGANFGVFDKNGRFLFRAGPALKTQKAHVTQLLSDGDAAGVARFLADWKAGSELKVNGLEGVYQLQVIQAEHTNIGLLIVHK